MTLFAAMLAATVACGGGSGDPRCAAREALQDAVRAIGRAESAESTGDIDRVEQQIDEAARLIDVARRNLSSASTSSVDRHMLEAAEYLDFIVSAYRASRAVDGTLAQFASRELSQAPTPGEAALNC